MHRSSEPARPIHTISSVTMAAAVFVQRFDDFIAEIEVHTLTAAEGARLERFRLAAEIITQAITSSTPSHQ